MMYSRRRFLGLTSIALAFPMLAKAQGEVASPHTSPSETLRISGNVEAPLQFGWTALRSQPQVSLPDVQVRDREGSVVKIHKGYEGIPLIRLLDQVRIRQSEPIALKRSVIVAQATDGYVAVFSWNELYNSPVGEQVFVLTGQAGEPLGDNEGRIALISLQDRRTGPRHVRWLNEIRVELISVRD